MHSALIIGLDSTIGYALFKKLHQAGWLTWGTTRKKAPTPPYVIHLDLTSITPIKLPHPVDIVYLCAGITNMAACQKDPIYAEHINVHATLQLAANFLKQGTHVVYLSSNAVFNGQRPQYKTIDATCPITVYGMHKDKVEKALLPFLPHISIVRLTKVLTPHYPLFTQWIGALKRHQVIKPYRHLTLCPISIDLVTHCLKIIGEKKIPGLIHLSGEKDVSYREVAQYFVTTLHCSPSLIVEQDMIESTVTAHPATYTSLDMQDSIPLLNISQQDLSFFNTMHHLYHGIT